MKIEMTPSVYLALCALVKDAMEVESDATPVLHQAARTLAAAAASIEGLPDAEARITAISDMAVAAGQKSAA